MSAPSPDWTPQFGERVRIVGVEGFEGETGQVCSVVTVPGQAVYVMPDSADDRWPALLMQPHEIAPVSPVTP